MKKIFLILIVLINVLFAKVDFETIKFNNELSNEIFETVDLVYLNTDEMKTSSLYILVSENKDYEVSFMVDRYEVEKSKYTLMSIRFINTNVSISKSTLFLIKIERDKSITMIKDDNNILSKSEILDKQDVILNFVKEYKNELNKIYKIKQNKKNDLKNKFMSL